MRKKIIIILTICIITLILASCSVMELVLGDIKYNIAIVRIYKGTPAWVLAKAVKRENTNRIKKILEKKPELLNYQEPLYGATLLLWRVVSNNL